MVGIRPLALLRLSSSQSLTRFFSTSGRYNGAITTWNKDWKAGPYPVTKEQRAAAAKKYGLIEEDYEPFPDKEWGDYPKIPDVGGSSKDPYYHWDYPDHRFNFGEPRHMDWECYLEDRFEPQSFQKGYWPKGWTYGKMRVILFSWFFGFMAFCFLTSNIVYNLGCLPKQFPADVSQKGLRHYTFDLKEC